jgi:glutathione S-transferase
MKLYTFVGSPNGRKAEAVIRHLGLPVEIEYLDFLAGELGRPEYRALNPNAKVPTLVDGFFTLWESGAILIYLAESGSDMSLFPRGIKVRTDVIRWLIWEQAHFNRAFGEIVFESLIKPQFGLGPTNETWVEAARGNLARYAAVLDQHVRDRPWLVGDGLTIADFAVAPLESYRARMPFDWSPYPAANAYLDRVSALEAWRSTAPKSPDAVGRRPVAA